MNWDEFSGWYIAFTDHHTMAPLYILNFTPSKIRCFVFCFLFNNDIYFNVFFLLVLFHYIYIFFHFQVNINGRPHQTNCIQYCGSNQQVRNLKLTSFYSTLISAILRKYVARTLAHRHTDNVQFSGNSFRRRQTMIKTRAHYTRGDANLSIEMTGDELLRYSRTLRTMF